MRLLLVFLAFVSGCGDPQIRSASGQLFARPGALDFGAVPAGGQTQRIVSLENQGTGEVHLSRVWLLDASAGFSVVSAPSTVGAGLSAEVTIALLAPGAAGSLTTSLFVDSDAANAPSIEVPLVVRIEGALDAGPRFDAGADAGPRLDAGADAGPRLDAGTDAGTDAGMFDAGTDAGPMFDAGVFDAGSLVVELRGGSEGMTCARRADGSVFCWGEGTSDVPSVIPGLGPSTGLAVGTSACALQPGGTVRCWGDNSFGQLGDGTQTSRATPTMVQGLTDAVAVAAFGSNACALRATGTVACWGANGLGQLGLGSSGPDVLVPVAVPGLANVNLIAVGSGLACARVQSGAVSCWGDTQLALGLVATPTVVPALFGSTQLALGWTHSCALQPGAQVVCWGDDTQGAVGGGALAYHVGSPTTVPGLTDAVQVVVAMYTSCARRLNGQLSCWGGGSEGELGEGLNLTRLSPMVVPGFNDLVGLSASNQTVCAARASGALACWGRNSVGELGSGWRSFASRPQPVQRVAGVTALGAGSGQQCLVADGGVWCAGENAHRPLNDGSTINRYLPTATGLAGAMAVDVDTFAGCAVLSTGRVSCWGANDSGLLGDGTTTPRSGAGLVPGVTSAVEVHVGTGHACARTSTGQVWCWGDNTRGQLGAGSASPLLAATQVLGLSDATGLAGGRFHTCALRASGAVACWGNNTSGQLGDGSTTNRTSPVAAIGLSDARGLGAGDLFSCAVRSNGRVWCWGDDSVGQFGDGSSVNQPAPAPAMGGFSDVLEVQGGAHHACVRRASGAVWCAGLGNRGQLGDGLSLSSTTPVAVSGAGTAAGLALGEFFSCARRVDGSAVCWGSNEAGALGNGQDNRLPQQVQSP